LGENSAIGANSVTGGEQCEWSSVI
jgi:hypothetical protein